VIGIPKHLKREPKKRLPLPRPTKRIRARNPKRAKRLFTEDFGSKKYLEAIHVMPCAICGVYGWTVPAHTRSRGAGGKVDDIVPLCCSRWWIEGCHERYDRREVVARYHELRLRTLAKKLHADFQAHTTERE